MTYTFNLKRYSFLLVAALLTCIASCKTERFAPVDESVKDLSGTWRVVKATRNGTDLTTVINFAEFKVKFDATGNYTLVNPLPFIVSKDGKYKLDDPNYPFKITFTATGGQPLVTAFNYPIIAGARQLNLTFSPGCSLNTYIYTMVKE